MNDFEQQENHSARRRGNPGVKTAQRMDELGNTCGVIAELGVLGTGAIVSEEGIARMFNRRPTSVKRAVERGELPPPCRLFGGNVWTVGAVVRHIEDRLQRAAKEMEALAEKVKRLSP